MKLNRLILESLSTLTLIMCVSASSAAQAVIQTPPPGKPNEAISLAKFRAMIDAINQRARELGLVSIPDDEQAELYQRRMETQLRDDFVKLYSVNVQTLASLDYKSLAETTADLKNRATRIKYNVPLLMVSGGEKPRYESNPDQLPAMIPELRRLIDSFFASPVFRESSPNDAQFRAKAVHDLEGIIALSDAINHASKRLIRSSPSAK